ncbi:MAG TPA: hypothetical protein VKW08_25900 [Xanthobacteraceae bacterium]|jgi:hypothetical protein|nr:hypothetical protein [Xanthobacteraceae bacterium]
MSLARRGFLGGLTGAAVGLIAGRAVRAGGIIDARVAIAHEDAGRPIPPDFLGLSYESAILVDADYFSLENSSVLGLIGALGRSGVIRIGGNTSARTVWRPRGEAAAPESLAIAPRSIDGLAGVMRRLRWKLIYGLNLARGTPQAAAEEAAYVARVLGPDLLAFQIGNEPDGFGRWAAVRPPSYDARSYLVEWKKFAAAVRTRVPGSRFAGPDVAAAVDWVAAFARARPEGLSLLTCHYYAEGPAGSAGATLEKLLHADKQAAAMLAALAGAASTYRLPYRIVEANSVYNEGEPGVSDTLAAALWGLELLFQAAQAGAAGVNFHAGVHNSRPAEDKAYTPIARSAGGRYSARPLYYGMLMFAQAVRAGHLLPTRLAPANDDLRAFAVRSSDAGLRVCLINKNPSRAVRIRVDAVRRVAGASLLRLAGPSLDATAGITLGGASVDELGRWAPAAEPLAPVDRELVVSLEPASAALLTMEASEKRSRHAMGQD